MSAQAPVLRVSLAAVLFWTLLVLASLVWNILTHQRLSIIEVAKSEARTNVNKDMAFRRWVTSHGGVYVRPTEQTPPNPYLKVEKRDVVTTDNDHLTLMNPAYVMREVMTNYAQDYGIQGHLTAKKLMNPGNAPDEWELRALDILETGVREVTEVMKIGGREHMRLAQPVFMERGCMKCHAGMGIPVGGIRGAITTAIPLDPLKEIAAPGLRAIISTHFGVWIIGILSIWLGDAYIRRKEEEKSRFRAEAAERLLYQSTHDELTGFANRRLLDDRLGFAIARAERSGHKVGVIYIDLDNFKLINESYGYRLGDDAIRDFAGRLRGLVRDEDTLARIGGDEFVALVECESSSDIVTTATRILAATNSPLAVGDSAVYLTSSVGISLYPDDGVDIETLIKHADVAMHRAKEQGRNAYQFFANEMNERATRRVALETGIRGALERNEFFLVYQPQVSLLGQRVVGLEALIRWRHPDKGVLSPLAFIPVAEESDLIIRIGDWVVEEACRQIAHWRSSGIDVPTVSVNIAARHFRQGDLVTRVEESLRRHAVPAAKLCIEITESALISNNDKAGEILWALRRMGATISLDDFGTGFSSLSYLKRFPIQEVKIDKSFVDGIASERNNLAIATAIVAMAHSLDMHTVAEGVENQEQLDVLAKLGCDVVQGYFFARPMPANELESWVQHAEYPLARQPGLFS